jgi:hypothetical protein
LRTKRPFTSNSFAEVRYAIGNALVAVLTNSMAVMKAAAKAVAVSRAEVRANISISLFDVRLDLSPTPLSMQGVCQFEIIFVFQ